LPAASFRGLLESLARCPGREVIQFRPNDAYSDGNIRGNIAINRKVSPENNIKMSCSIGVIVSNDNGNIRSD
jgi:hypothetical protein